MRLPVVAKKKLNDEIIEISFGNNGQLNFQAGQYIRVLVPQLEKEDTRGLGRVFSITSSPDNKEKIDIIYREGEGGYKKALSNTAIGTELEIEGPWGTLPLPEGAKQIVMIAGGTGIAPFLSILRTRDNEKQNIILIYSARDPQNAIYLEELQQLKKARESFRLATTFNRVNETLLKEYVIPDALYYISGPPPMIDSVIQILNKIGISSEQIYFEEWSEIAFKQVFGTMNLTLPELIIATDLNGFFRYVSPNFEATSGWKKEEIIGKYTPRILKSGQKDKAFYKDVWDSSLNGEVQRAEIMDKRKDGTFYYVDESILALRGQAGCIFGHVELQRDITKRVELEDTLAEEKAKAESILLSIGEAIVVTDTNRNVLFTNKIASDTLGYKTEELVGKVWTDIVAPQDEHGIIPIEKTPVERAIREGKNVPATALFKYRRKDEKWIPVSISSSPVILNGKVTGAVVVFRDITRDLELDRMKDEFVSVAAHDLRTPLTVIKGYLSMALEGDGGPISDKARKFLDEAYKGNERLIHLVNDFLNVSRLEWGTIKIKPTKTDLAALVETAVKDFSIIAKEKGFVINYQKTKLPLVLADGERVTECLANLLGNAVKFTERGKVTVNHEVKDGFVITNVTDTGIGISKEAQGNLFQKFFKAGTENSQGGLGLGLYISRLLIEGQEGKIWAKSDEGVGSTFSFSLPVVK